MLIKRAADIAPSEITPQAAYLRRREFLAGTAALGLGALLPEPGRAAPLAASKSPLSTTAEPQTALKDIISYNNFYEFGVDKDDPVKHAHTLKTKPWKVKVDGLVGKTRRLRPRRPHQGYRPGGAHLPHAPAWKAGRW
jgi:sulfoxide reductase catalytic subunit YedY